MILQLEQAKLSLGELKDGIHDLGDSIGYEDLKKEVEELENKEIAKIMRKSVRSIESLLLRARKQVKELLLKGGFQYEE